MSSKATTLLAQAEAHELIAQAHLAIAESYRELAFAPDDEKQLISVKELAAQAGISAKTIYRNPDKFGGKRMGGQWRFPADVAS